VGIVSRREIAAADDPVAHRDVLAEAYAGEHLSAERSAAEGHIDEVILPSETRPRLIGALSTLDGIAAPVAGVRNIPL
jgi:acetyl-CoA carboxylase carboxyltransferase component